MEKICSVCKQKKPLSQFYNRKAAKDGKYSCCKVCAGEMRKKTEQKYPHYQVHMQRKKRYGMSREQYEALLEKQGGKCAICRSPSPGRKAIFFCVDHCHETGKVRGLLCKRCNMGLGYFLDKTKLLRRAIKYLEENKS